MRLVAYDRGMIAAQVISQRWDPMAGAGLSDCVAAHMDCGRGFDFLIFLAAPFLLFVLLIHALFATAATLDIVDRPTGVWRGLGWTAVAWLLPGAGPFIWWAVGARSCPVAPPTRQP